MTMNTSLRLRVAPDRRCGSREACAHLELATRRQDRRNREPRAVGHEGPGFFDAPHLGHPRAARPPDDRVGARPAARSMSGTPSTTPVTRRTHRDHPHRTTEDETGGHPAGASGRRHDGPGAAHRGRQQGLRRRPQAQAGGGDHGRRPAPRAWRHPRDPRRQRLRQVDAHPPHQRAADPGQGSGRGLRPRHRARGDGGQATDQSGQRGRRLLQEAQPDGEPAVRGPPLRARRQGGQARRHRHPGAGSASARSVSAGRWSR